MSIFTKPFNKVKAGLSALGSKFTARSGRAKVDKKDRGPSPLAWAGKLKRALFGNIYKKIDASLAESKEKAQLEVKRAINKNIDKFIFECVLRWFSYIGLLLLAYVNARAFNLRKDVLVAFVILGIYTFYVIKFATLCSWYFSFIRKNGFIFNPMRIMKAYLHKAILARVQIARSVLPLPHKLVMNFFGPASDAIANDIASKSLQSSELWLEAIARLGMWICGWIIYLLIYEKLFLLVSGIDFNAFWEPLIWPLHVLFNILSVN